MLVILEGAVTVPIEIEGVIFSMDLGCILLFYLKLAVLALPDERNG